MISSKYFFAFCLHNGLRNFIAINYFAYSLDLTFYFKYGSKLLSEDFVTCEHGPMIPPMYLEEFNDVDDLPYNLYQSRIEEGYYISMLEELKFVDFSFNNISVEDILCSFEDILDEFLVEPLELSNQRDNSICSLPTRLSLLIIFIRHPHNAWALNYSDGIKNIIPFDDIVLRYIELNNQAFHLAQSTQIEL